MSVPEVGTAHWVRDTIGPLGVCVALAALGVAVLHGVLVWSAAREPYIDLGRRSAAATADRAPAGGEAPLRFAVAAMVSAEATFSTYQQLVHRICRDVGRRQAFVLRPSYAEVRRDIEEGNVDLALVCTGTYVHSLDRQSARLLVQPEFEAGLEYRSLLIVPAGSSRSGWEDLRGRVMAFTDRESNTGCLVPCSALAERGYDPKTFFRRIIFTGSHDRSIRAVAREVVDAASVDALVWESCLRQDATLARHVKVIWRSEAFGPPPVVVPLKQDEGLVRSLREAFVALDRDAEGRAILAGLGIRRFVPARPEDYRTAAELFQRMQDRGGVQWP